MSSIKSRITKINQIPNELVVFAIAIFALGVGSNIFSSVFNNFLDDRYMLTAFQRSFLEFPRELPGFLVVFVTAGLAFLPSNRFASVTMILCSVGALLIAFVAPTYIVMTIWLFIFSLGQHLFMPLNTSIGMDLASKGREGHRLGQLNAVRNVAMITGSFIVVLGFKYLNFEYIHAYIFAAVGSGIAAYLLLTMKKVETQPAKSYLKLYKEYRVYYYLVIITGARKQIFMTFAPWVLVTIFHQPTQIIASLMLVGGIIGIVFQPILGKTIDKLGETVVLCSEAVILVFICLGYGFSKFIFPEATAFLIVCGCYILDQMVFSVSMARATYIKKIALQPDHVKSTLSAGVTIDHIFSISAAVVGGIIWNNYGFQYVFGFGALLAVVNFFVASRVKIPEQY